MQALKARVQDGRIMLDEPTTLPNGTELYLIPAHDVVLLQNDGLAEEERQQLLKVIDESLAEADAGKVEDLSAVIAETNGVDLFVKRLGKMINASREGQLGMRAVLLGSLARVEYDRAGRAVRLFPLLRRADAPRSIVIDPRRAFGRPVLAGTSVPAADVRARFDAGDGVDELARDYDVSPELIEDALRATPQAA